MSADAERYDRDLEDIFTVQDEITHNIVRSVGSEFLSAEMKRAQRKDVRNLDVWDYIMRASSHHGRYTKKDATEAQRLLQKAIELDPMSPEAFCLLAFTHLMQVQFGWSIRQQDIESYILQLDYVESVTDFSMLHITIDKDGNYRLLDTANEELNPKAVIRPRYPWSLAVPMEQHYIKSRPDTKFIKAEITGVDELAVGSTFIIVGSSENGETK